MPEIHTENKTPMYSVSRTHWTMYLKVVMMIANNLTKEQKVSVALGVMPNGATIFHVSPKYGNSRSDFNHYYMYVDGYWYKYYDKTYTGKRDTLDYVTQRKLTKEYLS